MARQILLVEDNPADAGLLQRAIGRIDPEMAIVVLEDGAEAVDHFARIRERRERPTCDLVLLDLNLPRISGFEVLEYLKSDPALRTIPVVVFTGSSNPDDVDRCYRAGANSYISKPVGLEEIMEKTARLITFWFHDVKLPRR